MVMPCPWFHVQEILRYTFVLLEGLYVPQQQQIFARPHGKSEITWNMTDISKISPFLLSRFAEEEDEKNANAALRLHSVRLTFLKIITKFMF